MKNCRLFLKKKLDCSLKTIQVPTFNRGTTKWNTIQDKEEIEDAILKHSQKHLSQAEGSIPTIPPMSTILGDGHNEECKKVLEGTFTTSLPITEEMKMYLQLMERKNKKENTNTMISIKNIKNGFKK